jgi:hypothetical protein
VKPQLHEFVTKNKIPAAAWLGGCCCGQHKDQIIKIPILDILPSVMIFVSQLLSDRVEWNPATMIPKPADGVMLIRARHRGRN